jgi:hypothetical protein
MTNEEEIALLNAELKKVRSQEQLKALLHKAGWDMEHGSYHLQGKRRGYTAYEFTPYPPNPAKTHYLYDDGISVGLSRYENLHRVLKFR